MNNLTYQTLQYSRAKTIISLMESLDFDLTGDIYESKGLYIELINHGKEGKIEILISDNLGYNTYKSTIIMDKHYNFKLDFRKQVTDYNGVVIKENLINFKSFLDYFIETVESEFYRNLIK